MGIIQASNLQFESTGNNAISYNSNVITLTVGGANVGSINSTSFSINNVPLTLNAGNVNKFRNGTMDVWQRGNTTVTTTGQYTADGWFVIPTGASVTANTAAGRLYTVNSLQVTGATSVTDVKVIQPIESYISAPMSGQVVTFQAQIFNNTLATITPTISVKHPSVQDTYTANTVDIVATNLQSCANGVWTQVSYSWTASANSNLGMEIILDFGNNFSATTKFIQITECDLRVTQGLSVGLNPTPPPPELRPIFSELPFNQRYYYRRTRISATVNEIIGQLQVDTTTQSFGKIFDFPVQMRTTPIANVSSAASFSSYNAAASALEVVSSFSVLTASPYAMFCTGGINTSSTIGAAGGCSALSINAQGAWLDATAEIAP